MALEVRVTGNGEVARMLREFGANAVNVSPALQSAANAVQTETDRLWAGERKPLAASTVARKRRQGLPSTPLVATGDTRESAHNLSTVVTPRSLTVGTEPRQSKAQRYRGRNVMPETKRVVGVTMREIYRHLDVDKP